MGTSRATALAANPEHEHDYSGLLSGVRQAFAAATESGAPLFCTTAANLYNLYLLSLPEHLRQVHNCHSCRRFFEQYGGLATVGDDGLLVSAFWNAAAKEPAFYAEAFSSLNTSIRHAKITSVFYTSAPTWGIPQTGEWTHLAVVPSGQYIFRERRLSLKRSRT